MRRILGLFVALIVGAVPCARAAHTQARLVLSAETARPGDTILAAVELTMDPGWHTYWKNSGASGIPTTIQWDLPPGFTTGEIQWPIPEKLPPDELTTFIYENQVMLMVPITIPSNVPTGSIELKAKVSWLECQQLCVPGKAQVTATLQIGADLKESTNAARIRAWQSKLPQLGTPLAAHGWWQKDPTNDLRPVVIEWTFSNAVSQVDFYPFASQDLEVLSQADRLPSDAGKLRLRKMVKRFQNAAWPKWLEGVLIQKTSGQETAFDVKVPVDVAATASGGADSFPSAATPPQPESGMTGPRHPLWLNLIYGFLGGIVLNVMPCVLPVIALKILGFVSEARNDPRRVRRLGLVYTAGVLVSFLALAAVVIGVKAAGHKAAWGMQFSNPQFVVALTALVTLVALNLFGVFEVNLGAATMNAAGALASRHGVSGAFFNGMLTTVLATPCTAPFLAGAVGYALKEPAPVICSVFLAAGAGLASPYLLLSCQPAWLTWLPKPGPWMQRFKVAMGFPMLATAIWLLSLLPSYYGTRSWWLGIFLVVLSLAAWIFGEFVQRNTRSRFVATFVILVLLAAGYGYLVEGKLQWRNETAATAAVGPGKGSPDGIDWQPWSAKAVAHTQEEGHPVLVDFTAAWCLTCQVNKEVALDIPSVRLKLKEIGAATLIGDYTRFPDDITDELNKHDRAGVPLVLVYPPRAGAQPIVLPSVLTPGIVLNALDKAAK